MGTICSSVSIRGTSHCSGPMQCAREMCSFAYLDADCKLLQEGRSSIFIAVPTYCVGALVFSAGWCMCILMVLRPHLT